MRSAASLVLVLALLTSCGSRASNSGAGRQLPSSSPIPSAAVDGTIAWLDRPATPSPAARGTALVASCKASDVQGTFSGGGAAAGSLGGEFSLTVIGSACMLPGNPAATYRSADGTAVLSTAERVPPPGTVWIARPGATGKDAAFFLFQWSRHTGEPNYRCTTIGPPVASIDVTLGAGVLQLPFPADRRPTFCAQPPEQVFSWISVRDLVTEPLPEPMFDATIQAPDRARAGTRLSYVVALTNRTTDVVRLDPCPTYVESVAGPQELGSSDRPGFQYVQRRYVLNCAELPEVAAGETIRLAMALDLPVDLLPGVYVLPWRMDGPIWSTGTKVTVWIDAP